MTSRPRSRAQRAIAVAVSLFVVTACSGNDAATPATTVPAESTTAPSDTNADQDRATEVGPTTHRVLMRPVIQLLGVETPDEADPADGDDPNDPFAQVVLEDRDGAAYLLGPAFPDAAGVPVGGNVFRNDARADIVQGQWVVVVGLRPGADGRDRWNGAVTECFNRTEVCPSGLLAIVLDGEVISAPEVQTPEFDDVVQITGDFNESDARYLARVLEFGS